MMRYSKKLLSLGIGSLLAVAACASGGGSGGGSSSDSSVIKLGFVYEGGGGLNATSVSFVHGAQVAIDEVNAAGGVQVDGKKYTFQLDTCNDHDDQTQTTGCADKLVLNDGDKFVFGGLADFGPIVRGVTEPHHAVYFSTGPAVAALMSQSHYVVDIVPSLAVRAAADVAAIQKFYPGATRIAFLGDQALAWTQDVAAMEAAMKGTDLQVVASEVAPLTLTDFSALLTKVEQSHPDILVSFGTAPDRTETLLEENARLHVVTKFFDPSAVCGAITAGSDGVAIAGNTNTGALLSGPQENSIAKKYVQDFYADNWKPNPDPNVSDALYLYDDIGWLRDAMEKANTTDDVTNILAAMNSITYTGVNGVITMKDNQETYGQVMCYSPNGGAPYQPVLIPPQS
jgi:branched-chain amino acid transport system substrate-binding protein